MAARVLSETVDRTKDDEITIERRVKVRDVAEDDSARVTTKMSKVDSRLIAIARGEVEPEDVFGLFVMDDPFGGLIPVLDDEAPLEVLDEWVLYEVAEPEPLSSADIEMAIAMSAVPRLCMDTAQLVALPLDHRTGFLLSHIDGQRTVDEVIDVSHLSPADTLEVLAGLVELGVIAID